MAAVDAADAAAQGAAETVRRLLREASTPAPFEWTPPPYEMPLITTFAGLAEALTELEAAVNPDATLRRDLSNALQTAIAREKSGAPSAGESGAVAAPSAEGSGAPSAGDSGAVAAQSAEVSGAQSAEVAASHRRQRGYRAGGPNARWHSERHAAKRRGEDMEA